MTKQDILNALDEILTIGTGDRELLFRQDVQELRDEIRRDLTLFPEVYTCPTSRPPSSSKP